MSQQVNYPTIAPLHTLEPRVLNSPRTPSDGVSTYWFPLQPTSFVLAPIQMIPEQKPPPKCIRTPNTQVLHTFVNATENVSCVPLTKIEKVRKTKPAGFSVTVFQRDGSCTVEDIRFGKDNKLVKNKWSQVKMK